MNATDASTRGTWMHLQVERLLNSGIVHLDCAEMQLFMKFLRADAPKLTAYRTEWCIYGDDEQLAGSIDFVAQAEKGGVVLFDWKRSKNLQQKYTSRWSSMKQPLQHLDDCSGIHYRLQLNLCKFLLEKYYGLQVVGMFVACFHPDNAIAGPFVDAVPAMTKEVDAMLRFHKHRLLEMSGGAVAKPQAVITTLRSQQEIHLPHLPALARLIPSEADFRSLSKRAWERCVRWSRVILDFLMQDL